MLEGIFIGLATAFTLQNIVFVIMGCLVGTFVAGIIQADTRADHGVFSDVWSEVKNAGAKKISLSTRND